MVIEKNVVTEKSEKREVTEEKKKKEKRYSITFSPRETAFIKEMAEKEGVSVAELIRRAIYFYQVKRKADEENLDIYLEDKEGKKRILVLK